MVLSYSYASWDLKLTFQYTLTAQSYKATHGPAVGKQYLHIAKKNIRDIPTTFY